MWRVDTALKASCRIQLAGPPQSFHCLSGTMFVSYAGHVGLHRLAKKQRIASAHTHSHDCKAVFEALLTARASTSIAECQRSRATVLSRVHYCAEVKSALDAVSAHWAAPGV